ncbi:MAG: hypothetical protein ABSD49_14405 [Candidatus Bathyarchaeia archaeon]
MTLKIIKEYDRPYTDHNLPPVTRVAQCLTEKANYIILNTPHGSIDVDLNLGFVLVDHQALQHFGGTRQILVIPMDGERRNERIGFQPLSRGEKLAIHQGISSQL